MISYVPTFFCELTTAAVALPGLWCRVELQGMAGGGAMRLGRLGRLGLVDQWKLPPQEGLTDFEAKTGVFTLEFGKDSVSKGMFSPNKRTWRSSVDVSWEGEVILIGFLKSTWNFPQVLDSNEQSDHSHLSFIVSLRFGAVCPKCQWITPSARLGKKG